MTPFHKLYSIDIQVCVWIEEAKDDSDEKGMYGSALTLL